MRILLCLLATASILVFTRPALSQTDSSSANASSSTKSRLDSPFWISTGRSYWGFDLGATGTDYIGAKNFLWGIVTTVNTTYDAPEIATYLPYSNLGTGIGFVGGLKAGLAVSSIFDLEAKARFMTNHTSKEEDVSGIILDTYHPTSPSPLTSNATDNYSLTLSTLDLTILGHLHLTDALYAAGGFSVSDLIANSFSASQTVTSQQYIDLVSAGTTTLNNQQAGPESLDNWFVGFRADAQIGAGYVFRIGSNNMLMDVEGLVSIPFTKWQTKEADSSLNATAKFWTPEPAAPAPQVQPLPITDPHLWYATLTVGLRLPFHDLPPVPIPPPPPPIVPDPVSPSPILSLHPTEDSLGYILSGRVTDALTGLPLIAQMTAVDLSNNQVLLKTQTDSNGNYSVRVGKPGQYSVTANAPGHLFGTTLFQVDSQGRILKSPEELKLGNLTGGKTRLLVFFDFDKAELKDASLPELNHAVEMMNQVPTMKVEIAGYSDSLGTLQHNIDLSGRRASAVRQYLVDHGIAANRLTASGYGPVPPIASNATDEGRAENRRVEFVVKER